MEKKKQQKLNMHIAIFPNSLQNHSYNLKAFRNEVSFWQIMWIWLYWATVLWSAPYVSSFCCVILFSMSKDIIKVTCLQPSIKDQALCSWKKKSHKFVKPLRIHRTELLCDYCLIIRNILFIPWEKKASKKKNIIADIELKVSLKLANSPQVLYFSLFLISSSFKHLAS